MESKPKVLLTDIHWRTAYYVCKSLAKKGIEVIGLRSVVSIYEKSRFYSKVITVPSLEINPTEWLSKIEQIASDGEVLIPVSVEAIKLVAENQDRLSRRLIVPRTTIEQLLVAMDKSRAIALMQNIGVPVPITVLPQSLSEAEKAFLSLRPPVVVKLCYEGNISPADRYGIARSREEFLEIYRRLSVTQSRVLMQEYIPGQGVGISILADKGRLLALFSHQRLRERIVSGGPSTYCAPLDSQRLEEYAWRFAEATGWDGVAMLEFKFNHAQDKYYFMEINPRFWGSMELAIKCGVDFPFLFYEWMIGNADTTCPVRRKKDFKLKYMSMDIQAFASHLSSVDRRRRLRLLIYYIIEYFDPKLRFEIAGNDWKIALHELSLVICGLKDLWKHVF